MTKPDRAYLLQQRVLLAYMELLLETSPDQLPAVQRDACAADLKLVLSRVDAMLKRDEPGTPCPRAVDRGPGVSGGMGFGW